MENAKRDQNFVPTLLGVSNVDGATPVPIYADPVTHRLLVDLPSGTGTVTSVSVVSANGFAGTVATATTTPAITLSTTVTGILYGNGTSVSALTIGSGLQLVGSTLSTTGGGTGDVVGPASATDNALARFNTTTGKLLQDGTLSASDVAAGAVTLATIGNNDLVLATGNVTTGSITIADGVDGDITIAPNGDGYTYVNAKNLYIVGNSTGVFGPIVTFLHDSATPAANDIVSTLDFKGRDSAANEQSYAGIQTVALDTTSTSEDGKLVFYVTTAGSSADELELTGAALYPTTNDGLALGISGTAFSDLFLASGGVINWSAGDMSLTHSAGTLTVSNTATGALGPILTLYQDSASPAAADSVGLINFNGKDSAGNLQTYGTVAGVIVDPTNTTEAGKLVFGVGTPGASTNKLELYTNSLSPAANDGIALGTTALMWSDLFLASGGVINFNNGNATLTHSTGLLTSNVPLSLGTSNALTAGTIELGAASDTTLSRSAAGVLAVEGVVIPSISSTNTLTNKRVTPRVGTTTSSATPTINTDNVDYYSLTAQTVDITSFTTNLSGTPTDGQMLRISITGTAARAITWGSSFEASTVALPTTTVTTNRLDVGFVWNAATSKWRCIASA
jgi:hypothetical protein